MAKISSEQRRERILKIAVSLFSRHGFDGTTTRQLARKCGISEALLFRHFADKEKLYAAILQRKMDEQLSVLFADLPAEQGPDVLLSVLACRIVRLHESDPAFLRLLLYSALESHRLSDLFFRKRNLPVVEFLTDYFRKAVQRGQMRDLDPEGTAFAFMAMVIGYVQSRTVFRIPQVVKDDPEERMKRYVDIFVKGVRP